MIPVPKLDDVSVAFGETAHMPPYERIPQKFRDGRCQEAVAVSTWFFSGARRVGNTIVAGDVSFSPKPGVDVNDAVRAIQAILRSFQPKHEHKEAACAYLLAEWFETSAAK